MSLTGKVAVVTGASKGIGKATVLRLAKDGASVVINYSSDASPAEELVKTIGSDKALAVQANVGKISEIEKLVKQAVDKFGKIDILIANAGVAPNKDLEHTTEEDFDMTMDLNIKGPYFLCQKAVPHMAPGSRIILLSTSLCINSGLTPNYLLYVTSKGATEQMVRVMAKDVARKGITVNAISPGPTGTELFYKGKSEQLINMIAGQSPFQKLGEPDEIADAMVFLCSHDSRWVSGQNIRVNGAAMTILVVGELKRVKPWIQKFRSRSGSGALDWSSLAELTVRLLSMSPTRADTLSQPSPPDLDILGDQVTIHPGGYVEPPQADDASERNLVEHMARFRESPLDFLREVSLYVSGTGWRAYDDFIGQPIYYPGFSEVMKAAVMSTPMLQERIQELAERRVHVEDEQGLLGTGSEKVERRTARKEEILQSLQGVALRLTDGMICKFESKRFIRGAYYLCTQLLTRAYHQGIHVSSEEVLRLRSVAETAAKNKHSIIFLPCHRSHVDYVSLQLICYRLGIALPTVVAGDNLKIPVLGNFLQNAGAMWIRRSFGNNALYTTLVQSYMDTLLQNGYNVECFIEGGRSRTGKLLSPKFGILSFLLDSVLSGRAEDAIICPVSTQYDKVIETESYISELLGQPKPKENLKDFLSASSVLSLKLGRVDVRFHEPWSLRSFIAEQRGRVSDARPSSALSDPMSSESRVRLLRTLGFKVLSDINAVSVVMPTALIGTVLLTLRGRGVGKSELIRRVEWLSTRVRAKGGRVAHFAGAPTSTIIERGLEVLGPELVGTIDSLETTYQALDRFQLSFYRNMTIHLFISEALVCAAMYTKVKQGGGPDNQRISFNELYDQVGFLSSIFRGEFIYPTAGLLPNLHRTLLELEADRVITLTRHVSDNDASPTNPESHNISSVELSLLERRNGRENFDFYNFLIWPFVESTWLGAVSLMCLTPPSPDRSSTWLDVRKTQETAQLLGKTLYHQGDLSYFEAVNKETLKNAFQFFEEEGMVLIRKSPDKSTPSAMRLTPEWTPHRDNEGVIVPEGRLWDFIEKIAKSRREGKNRRDGATVSTRVLRLADLVGKQLFETAVVDGMEEQVEDQRRRGRRKKDGDARSKL
ncbi:MAG: hypothetical protein Q9218_000578 [Villophora microphyllina]